MSTLARYATLAAYIVVLLLVLWGANTLTQHPRPGIEYADYGTALAVGAIALGDIVHPPRRGR